MVPPCETGRSCRPVFLASGVVVSALRRRAAGRARHSDVGLQRLDVGIVMNKLRRLFDDVLSDAGRALACRQFALLRPAAEVGPVGYKRFVELRLVTRHCMFGGEEMAAWRDLCKRAKRFLGAVRSRLCAHFGNHLQHFHVGDEFLVGDAQPALKPAGGMDHDGGPGHEASPKRKLGLVRRLRVVDVGGRTAGAAPGKIDQSGKLACDQRGAEMFRRPKGWRAGFHVDIRGEGAIADRRPRTGKLGERDGGKCLGMAQCHRRFHGDRRHGAHQCEWCNDRQLPMACKIYQPLRHRNVDLAARVGVDDLVAVTFRHECFVVEASKITDHLETFAHLRGAAAEDVRKPVGFDKLRLHGEVLAQFGRHILRFDQGRYHLQNVEMLRHLYQFVKISCRSRAASPLKIRGMGCAGACLEDEAPWLEKHIPFWHTATAQD